MPEFQQALQAPRPSITPPRFASALATAVLLGSLVAAGLGVRWASQRVDQLASQVQQSQVLGTLDQYRDRLRSAAASELQWDEAVLQLDLAFDPAWADNSLAQWMLESQGIEHVVVYGEDDQPRYAAIDGERTDAAAVAAACPAGAAIEALRREEAARGTVRRPSRRFDTLLTQPIDHVDFALCDGRPVIRVATLVQPDFGRHLPDGARAPVVVMSKDLDAEVAERIAGSLMLAEARFEPRGSRPLGVASVALLNRDGLELGRFAWRPDRPGVEVLEEATPSFALAASGVLALALLALVRLRRAGESIRAHAGTAQRHAESLERMSALSRIGAWEIRAGGRDVVLSRESARILGLDAATPRPLARLLEGLAPPSIAPVETAIGDALRFGTSFDVTATTAGPEDRRRILRIQGRPFAGSDGRALEGTLHDITEQVQQAQAERRNTELLERMSRIADIGGWEYDVASRRLTFTDQSYRIYGLPGGSPVSISIIAERYSPADAQHIRSTLERALREGTPWDLELSPTTVDGRRIRVHGLGEAERVGGRVVRLYGTLQDTTAAHDAALRLREAMQRLEDRNAEIQQFTYAASHDLQEPARKVQALGSLLLSRHGAALDATARDCVERMQRSSERMALLVDDVLAYSRVALRPVEPVAVALGAVARDVLEDLESRIAETGAQVGVGPLPEVEGDPLQLRRLLQNLVSNALKYRHPGRTPEITVSAGTFHPEPGVAWCRMVVADNGIGFDPRHAEAIFLPFTRLQREGKGEGSGIGLAIVRRIAESHGGRVHAEGRPGEGARFVVEFPASQPHRAAQA
jgi:signal transduction histidine kinase/sensor domain CHASE-containing protein